MGKIKLLSAIWIAMLMMAGCSTTKVTQTLHQCTNLDQPGPFESVGRIEGSLLFDDNRTIEAINSTSSKEIIAFKSQVEILGLNPSGEWFAYLEYPSPSEPPLIQLISYRGEQRTVPVEAHPNGGLVRPLIWVNDETILMVGENVPIAFLDAFKGSWLLDILNNLPDRYRDTGIALSPDLSLALYVKNTGDESYKPLTLWDFKQQREVWRADESFGFSIFLLSIVGNASWSTDNTAVAFTLNRIKDFPPDLLHKQRFYLVDAKTGELHEFRTEAEDNAARLFSWSPDGRYIAIVTGLLTDPDHPGIIIYDRESDVSVDLCPMRKLDQWLYDQVDSNIYYPGLAWSPDSRYIVFGQGIDALSEDNRVSMLDIYTGEVTLLREGSRVQLIGWSPYDWTTP